MIGKIKYISILLLIVTVSYYVWSYFNPWEDARAILAEYNIENPIAISSRSESMSTLNKLEVVTTTFEEKYYISLTEFWNYPRVMKITNDNGNMEHEIEEVNIVNFLLFRSPLFLIIVVIILWVIPAQRNKGY